MKHVRAIVSNSRWYIGKLVELDYSNDGKFYVTLEDASLYNNSIPIGYYPTCYISGVSSIGEITEKEFSELSINNK